VKFRPILKKENNMKNKKELKLDEFRKNKTTGHPVHIYAKVGDEFKHIGITHSKVTQGIKNIKMEKNPDPKDDKPSYFKPKAEHQSTNKYGERKAGWKLSEIDKEKMKPYRK